MKVRYTVPSAVTRAAYVGNDVTVNFSVPFNFFDDSDLDVILVNDTTAVETVQVLTTNYTVTGGDGSTGTLTMLVAPATGYTLVIERDIPYTQEIDLEPNDPFPAEVTEEGFDRATMLAQQNRLEIQKSPKLPPTYDPDSDPEIRIPVPEAGKVLVGNDDEDGWENGKLGELSTADVPVILVDLEDGDILEYSDDASAWRNKTPPAYENDLPFGPLACWSRASSVGPDSGMRVPAVPGMTIAGEDGEEHFSVQQYFHPSTGHGLLFKWAADADLTKKANLVFPLTITQTAPLRGSTRVFSLYGQSGAGVIQPVRCEINYSLEDYQAIIDFDGKYRNGHETAVSELVVFPLTAPVFNSPLGVSGDIPENAKQVSVRLEFNPAGATLGTTAWYSISNLGMTLGAVPRHHYIDPNAVHAGERWYKSTYPHGTAPKNNPMFAGSLYCVARQVSVNQWGGDFYFPLNMETSPMVFVRSPQTGADNMVWNVTKAKDVAAQVKDVSSAGVAVAVAQGSSNVADYDVLRAHIVAESWL